MQVMIVDNDAALLRSLALLLEGQGHQVRAFGSPVAALASLGQGAAPEALVVDYVMPEMDGLTFLAAARRNLGRGCRVVLISGHTDLLAAQSLAAAGVHGFLAKPIDLDALVRLLNGTVPPAGVACEN